MLAGIPTQHQRHRVLRGLQKPVVLVKLFCTFMKGVDEQSADTGILRNAHRTTDGILQ